VDAKGTSSGLITRQEAARMLDIGLRTLDLHRSGGRGPVAHYVRLGGRRRLLYRQHDVARYKAERDRAREEASWNPEAARRLRTAIHLHTQKRLLAQEAGALRLSRGIRQTLRAVAA
jgi:hypothetical protein